MPSTRIQDLLPHAQLLYHLIYTAYVTFNVNTELESGLDDPLVPVGATDRD
jgi:hypothetical protein